MKNLFFLLFAFGPFMCTAQMQPVGALTVFSETGDRFFLILNGEKINTEAQTNVRVDELPQPYYNAKIIFENKALPQISKPVLPITEGGGEMLMDVTYRIKNSTQGKRKLTYFSAIPYPQNFIPPAGMFVQHWGGPQANVAVSGPAMGGTTTVQQRTVTTTQAGMGGAGMHMNGAGINVNVTVPTPVITETTTTTTTTSYGNNNNGGPTPATGGCNGVCMNGQRFAQAISSVRSSGFDDTRLSSARTILRTNCLNTEQVAQICRTFSFEESKLAFAKDAYTKVIDPQNYFSLASLFNFDSSKEELNSFISGQ